MLPHQCYPTLCNAFHPKHCRTLLWTFYNNLQINWQCTDCGMLTQLRALQWKNLNWKVHWNYRSQTAHRYTLYNTLHVIQHISHELYLSVWSASHSLTIFVTLQVLQEFSKSSQNFLFCTVFFRWMFGGAGVHSFIPLSHHSVRIIWVHYKISIKWRENQFIAKNQYERERASRQGDFGRFYLWLKRLIVESFSFCFYAPSYCIIIQIIRHMLSRGVMNECHVL